MTELKNFLNALDEFVNAVDEASELTLVSARTTDIAARDEAAAKEAERIIQTRDTEMSHVALDNLLCEVLENQGFTKLVQAFNKADKWYA